MMEPSQRHEGKNLKQQDGKVDIRTPVRSGPPKRIDARELLGDSRELRIMHGGQEYRLFMTSNGKLILTK